MTFNQMHLRQYYEKHKDVTKHISMSDSEALNMADLIAGADSESKSMWNNLKLSYTDSLGHPVLRQEIAQRYRTMQQEDVLITTGSQEAVYVVLKAMADAVKESSQNPEAIVMHPGYQPHAEDAMVFGCTVKRWDCDYSPDSGWKFQISALRAAVTDNSRILVMSIPHNPTGWCPSIAEFEEIVTICKEKDMYLLSDNIYSLIPRNDGLPYAPAAPDEYDKAVHVCGFSKTVGLPGIRIGWMATHNEDLMKRAAICKDYLSVCPAAPSEILGIMAFRQHQKIIDSRTEIIKKNLDYCDKLFADFSDVFDWQRPLGGTIAFIKIKGWLTKLGSGSATGFAESLLENKGLLVAPGHLFDMDGDHIRIGFGRQNFIEMAELLREFLIEKREELQ